MKSYNEFEKEYIGASDMGRLNLVGCGDGGIESHVLNFGEDASYSAYIVDASTRIGDHYKKVAEFECWMKIYSDDTLARKFESDKITVYRAGEMGCIIQLA